VLVERARREAETWVVGASSCVLRRMCLRRGCCCRVLWVHGEVVGCVSLEVCVQSRSLPLPGARTIRAKHSRDLVVGAAAHPVGACGAVGQAGVGEGPES
jgi:hypothetical protein